MTARYPLGGAEVALPPCLTSSLFFTLRYFTFLSWSAILVSSAMRKIHEICFPPTGYAVSLWPLQPSIVSPWEIRGRARIRGGKWHERGLLHPQRKTPC